MKLRPSFSQNCCESSVATLRRCLRDTGAGGRHHYHGVSTDQHDYTHSTGNLCEARVSVLQPRAWVDCVCRPLALSNVRLKARLTDCQAAFLTTRVIKTSVGGVSINCP